MFSKRRNKDGVVKLDGQKVQKSKSIRQLSKVQKNDLIQVKETK